MSDSYTPQPAAWHDLDSAREQWLDAPDDDTQLDELLEVAKQQVLAYANSDGSTVTTNLRMAQLMQARNAWNASVVDPSNGSVGEGSYVIRPFPLDWMVRQIIRPKSGVPVVG